ncbi:MAG TPA: ATP-binding protein [Polyangiaceae bacterium]|nr:ATP-binding protein [Polyangiaceae bacterium]
MAYVPLSELHALPPEGPLSNEARERQDLDFKSVADVATPWEHAKDVAAFANSLGGTILVGASNTDRVTLHGLRAQTAREVMDIYENAAMQCSPTVPVDPVPITLPSGSVVVAVNVAPYPDALVAAPAAVKSKPADGGKPKQERVENSWRFPVRRASQTHYLKPEELPLYMNPQARRAYIRLAAIPPHREGFLDGLSAHTYCPRILPDEEQRPWYRIASGAGFAAQRRFAGEECDHAPVLGQAEREWAGSWFQLCPSAANGRRGCVGNR